MKLGLIVPGGVDRSAEYRVIPALLALIRRLSRHHEVHVFALRQEARADCWELCGARIHNIGFKLNVLRAILEIHAEHRRAPFQLLQCLWSGAPGFIGVVCGKLLGIPCALHVAGGELTALPDIGYGGLLSWRGRWREAAVLRSAAAVSAASAPIIQALKVRRVCACRIPLGVDLDVWPPRPPERRNLTQPIRLVHLASLNRVKDQPTLLQAAARLARQGLDFHLDMIGEDTLHGEMQALSGRLKLAGRVKFHGFLPQGRARPLVASAHLLIVSSLHEAGPLAVLEAAVVGVPTVGTHVGHIAEWTPWAALSVPVADLEALSAAIARLAADEQLRLALAHAAFESATRQDADHTARCFESLYLTLLTPGAAVRHRSA